MSKLKTKIKNQILKLLFRNNNLVDSVIEKMLTDKNSKERVLATITQNVELSKEVIKELFQGKALQSNLLDNLPTYELRVKNRLSREVWLEKALKDIPNGSKILDAGAGELQYKKFCKHLEYVSQDFAQYDPKNVPEGYQQSDWDNSKLDIVSDIINIPVENESFDAIMCIEVFEHLPQPALAVKEFSRILKKGGKVIITVPFASITHFAPYFFANGYSKYWYKDILSENGFELIEITPNGNYFDYVAQELERLPEVALRYAKKELSLKDELAIKYLKDILSKFSKEGESSSELLTFGNHVIAVKI